MATKATRYVDAQGRIILPAHIRKALNLTEGHCVEIEIEDGSIRIRPIEERCSICGKALADQFIDMRDKKICPECARIIAHCVEQAREGE